MTTTEDVYAGGLRGTAQDAPTVEMELDLDAYAATHHTHTARGVPQRGNPGAAQQGASLHDWLPVPGGGFRRRMVARRAPTAARSAARTEKPARRSAGRVDAGRAVGRDGLQAARDQRMSPRLSRKAKRAR